MLLWVSGINIWFCSSVLVNGKFKEYKLDRKFEQTCFTHRFEFLVHKMQVCKSWMSTICTQVTIISSCRIKLIRDLAIFWLVVLLYLLCYSFFFPHWVFIGNIIWFYGYGHLYMCGYIFVSGGLVAFVANSSSTSLPGMPMWNRINMNLMMMNMMLVKRIMFWILRARLHLVCILVIEVTALIKSLKTRTLSWLVESEKNITSSITKVCAVYILEERVSLWSVWLSLCVMVKPYISINLIIVLEFIV